MDEPSHDDRVTNESESHELFTFRSIFFFEFIMAIAAIVLGMVFGPPANQWVPPIDQWRDIITGVSVGALLAIPMHFLVLQLDRFEWEPIIELREFTQQVIGPSFRRFSNMEIIALAIVSGVSEELLFRGWLQCLWTGPPAQWTTFSLILGLGIASITFGLAHWLNSLYAGVTFAMGLLFGIMLVVTGNLLVPISAHATYNYAQMRLLRRE